MARTARAVPEGELDLTAEDQALLDQMRTDDAAPVEDQQQQHDDQQQSADGDAGADQQQAGDQPSADQRQQMVPHAAMHEERVRRQQLEKTLETERQARATLEQRTNQLLERMQQAQQPAPQQQQQPQALPDPAADPVGHIMARLQRSEEARNQQDQVLGAVVQALTQQNQQSQQVQQAQTVQQRALAQEREFAAVTPDYVEAVSYLNDLRHRQLVAAGWDDPAERQAIIAQEAMGIAQRAAQANRSAAEMVYQLAKASGHTAQQAAAAVDNAGNAQNGQAPSNAQRLAQIGQGQRQNQQSLGNVRGNPPPPLTAQRLLEMPNDEFEKMLSTPEGRDLMGT